jgi:hypothetical protein
LFVDYAGKCIFSIIHIKQVDNFEYKFSKLVRNCKRLNYIKFVQLQNHRRDSMVLLASVSLLQARQAWKALLLLVLIGLVGSCGPPKMVPIPTKSLGEFDYRTSSEGLEIAVDPWTDPGQVKKHFGMDLLSRGIVPFELVFANVGADGGFFLQPQSIVILDDRGLEEIRSQTGRIAPSYLDPKVQGVTFFVSPAFAIGLTLITEEAYRDEQDVRRQMNLMQFIDRPLYKSDSNNGFLYLQFDDMTDLLKMAAVAFRVKNIRTRQEKMLIVLLKER